MMGGVGGGDVTCSECCRGELGEGLYCQTGRGVKGLEIGVCPGGRLLLSDCK